jgi:FMN phosphatase YigB (HAD superfamily)
MKTILVDAVNTFVIPGEGINKKMYEILENFPQKKIILTNADDNQILSFELNNLPYDLFTLKHSPEKTDPNYFTIMLNHFNLYSDEVVYFEHNLDAVKSARLSGINTFFYDKHKRDLKALKKFLDIELE